MQEIKTIIRGPYEPNDIYAIWIDTSNATLPLCKVHENGTWQVVGSAGGGGSDSREETTMPAAGFEPNISYKLGEITNNFIFLMQEGPEGQANHYFWVFDTGETVPEITWPENIRLWENNQAPEIVANSHYSVSVYDDVAMYEVIGPNSAPTGSIKVIHSSTNWFDPDIFMQGIDAETAAEAAEICGITEEELAAILNPDGTTPILMYLHGEAESSKLSGSGLVTVTIVDEGTENEDIFAVVRTRYTSLHDSDPHGAISLKIEKYYAYDDQSGTYNLAYYIYADNNTSDH